MQKVASAQNLTLNVTSGTTLAQTKAEFTAVLSVVAPSININISLINTGILQKQIIARMHSFNK